MNSFEELENSATEFKENTLKIKTLATKIEKLVEEFSKETQSINSLVENISAFDQVIAKIDQRLMGLDQIISNCITDQSKVLVEKIGEINESHKKSQGFLEKTILNLFDSFAYLTDEINGFQKSIKKEAADVKQNLVQLTLGLETHNKDIQRSFAEQNQIIKTIQNNQQASSAALKTKWDSSLKFFKAFLVFSIFNIILIITVIILLFTL